MGAAESAASQHLLHVLASLLFLLFGLWMPFEQRAGLAAAQTLRRRRRTEVPITGRSPGVV